VFDLEDNLYSNIFKRKSFHLFRNVGFETLTEGQISEIYEKFATFTPLIPNIRTEIKIVPEDETSCKRGAEYCILLFSEKKDGFLQNIGYIGEQLDLWLVSKNIGTLWFGIGKPDVKEYKGLDFVIMIAIRKITDQTKYRKDIIKSKRKTLNEIWKGEELDGVSNIIRFSPSACNTQPWYIEREKNILKIFRYRKNGKRGIMPVEKVVFYNQIDIGVLLCFLELCLRKNKIDFEMKLYNDGGIDKEYVLNAEYNLFL
jgi:hypothetical protein